MFAAVAVAALAAAALVVAGVLVTRSTTPEAAPTEPVEERPKRGAPPLVLELGVRDDAEARSLRAAAELYRRGERAAARRAFARRNALEAQVGAALAAWPRAPARDPRSLRRLEQLARAHPRSGVVYLHLGLARLWAGRTVSALAAWRAAARRDPDSPYAIRAGDLLHPNLPQGVPVFVPGFAPPTRIVALPPGRRLAALAAAASRGGVREKLLYGVALQTLGRQRSAERVYAAAAEQAPLDPRPHVAAAVARFEEARPERAFGRIGPLTRRFPRAPTVRFHLGLLLIWTGRLEAAERQLRAARALGPNTSIGREADRFLGRLVRR